MTTQQWDSLSLTAIKGVFAWVAVFCLHYSGWSWLQAMGILGLSFAVSIEQSLSELVAATREKKK